jgi:AcrR family transcriptional regulator
VRLDRAPNDSPAVATATERSPRRLPHDARQEQLVLAAAPIVAAQGLTEFSLDEVAATADVSRNLLYHYFPRGRPDIALAVVRLAERELGAGWNLDESLPLPDRVAANFRHVADHALRPSDAWLIHRHSRAAVEPELRAAAEQSLEFMVSVIARNQFGTSDPTPLGRLALRGYVAFAETVLDDSRAGGIPIAQVMHLMTDTLYATVRASRARQSRVAQV